MNKNYIILGASGYIGSAFCNFLKTSKKPYIALSRNEVDYTDLKTFENYIHMNWRNSEKPTENSVIINCSGFIGKPNVDVCEDNKSECIIGNIVTPQNISNLCRRLGLKFAHISSGCIYSGYDKQFTEEDLSNFNIQNGSFYSGTKAIAEQLILSSNTNSYIFRLRIPFDHIPDQRNYITKILNYDKLLDKNNSLSHRGEFVSSCISLIENKAPYGIFNLTNPGYVSAKDVIEIIKKVSPVMLSGKTVKFFDSDDDFNKHVRAPRSNCILSTSKSSKYVHMSPVKDILKQSIIDYSKNKYYCDELFRCCETAVV